MAEQFNTGTNKRFNLSKSSITTESDINSDDNQNNTAYFENSSVKKNGGHQRFNLDKSITVSREVDPQKVLDHTPNQNFKVTDQYELTNPNDKYNGQGSFEDFDNELSSKNKKNQIHKNNDNKPIEKYSNDSTKNMVPVISVILAIFLIGALSFIIYDIYKDNREILKEKSLITEVQRKQVSILDERERLEKILEGLWNNVAKGNYDAALLAVEKLEWTVEPDNYGNFVNLYHNKRENIRNTILRLKGHPDSMKDMGQNNDAPASDANIEYEDKNAINPVIIPCYASVINERAYFYDEPDINTRLSSYLNYGEIVQATILVGEFIFCTYTDENGNLIHEWMNKSDFKFQKKL